MALIKCSECGREVSELAQACPNCGSPIAAKHLTLTLTGFPKRYIGSKAVEVFHNGSRVGSVDKGTTVALTLPSGGQVDFVTHYMGRERRQSYNLPSGASFDLFFDFGPMGGLKVVEQGSGPITITGFTMEI
jgi:DNA-directed RNA polymerase subunit RPC12/RpoP